MLENLRILIKKDHVHAIVSGNFDPALAKTVYQKILDAADQKALSRVLIDARQLIIAFSTTVRYGLAEWVASIQKMPMMVAVVVPPDPMFKDRFVETVVQNRGAAMKVTADMQEALTWLGIVSGDAA